VRRPPRALASNRCPRSSRIRPANDREASRNVGNGWSIESAGQETDSSIAAGSEIGPENTLKVETRVQIPLGLRRSEAMSGCHGCKWPRIGPAAYTHSSRSVCSRSTADRAGRSRVLEVQKQAIVSHPACLTGNPRSWFAGLGDKGRQTPPQPSMQRDRGRTPPPLRDADPWVGATPPPLRGSISGSDRRPTPPLWSGPRRIRGLCSSHELLPCGRRLARWFSEDS
jgi:hypothetical protein